MSTSMEATYCRLFAHATVRVGIASPGQTQDTTVKVAVVEDVHEAVLVPVFTSRELTEERLNTETTPLA